MNQLWNSNHIIQKFVEITSSLIEKKTSNCSKKLAVRRRQAAAGGGGEVTDGSDGGETTCGGTKQRWLDAVVARRSPVALSLFENQHSLHQMKPEIWFHLSGLATKISSPAHFFKKIFGKFLATEIPSSNAIYGNGLIFPSHNLTFFQYCFSVAISVAKSIINFFRRWIPSLIWTFLVVRGWEGM